MKKYNSLKILITGLLCFFFLITLSVYSQQNQIPVTSNSQEAKSFFEEGRYKYENIQYATASALFDEAIVEDPGFAIAYLYRARCGGGYNVVRENLNKSVSLINKISEGEKLLIQFNKALEESDHKAQKGFIDKLLSLYPNDKRAHYNAGLYYDFITDPETALLHYLKAIKIDPEYAAAYNKIGYDFMDLGFMGAAEDAFKKYINLIPESPNPYDSYAELLMKQGSFEKSIIEYQTAYQKDVLFTQALAGIGHNYIFLGDYEKARDFYHRQHDKAVRSNEKLDALLWIAVSYLHEKNFDEAGKTLLLREQFAANENLIPDRIDTYNYLGTIFAEKQDFEKAADYFSKAENIIETADIPEPAKTGYLINSHLNRCMLKAWEGNVKEAKESIAQCSAAVNKRDNIADKKKLNFALGFLAFKENDFKAALDYFNKADTDDPYVWYYTAAIYNKLGYSENADTYLDRIKYWNKNSFDYGLVKAIM